MPGHGYPYKNNKFIPNLQYIEQSISSGIKILKTTHKTQKKISYVYELGVGKDSYTRQKNFKT